MKIEEAIRILHPDTSADEIAEIKYKYGFRGNEQAAHKIEKACKTAYMAMKKQLPKKPIVIGDDYCSRLSCPNCKSPIVNVWNKAEYEPNYCHYCGQCLDWSDTK